VTIHAAQASIECMPTSPLLLVLAVAALSLTGCAESSPAPDANQTAAVSIPAHTDHPPVTMSGYVETSTTAQIR
jgi:hypothetical protein